MIVATIQHEFPEKAERTQEEPKRPLVSNVIRVL
jgi:hypothetical protein